MIVGCVSLLAAHTVCARDSQKDLPLEKRSTELTTRVVADGEFLKSWKQGSMVKGITSFKLEGHFEVTDSGKLKFFDKWKKWGKQKFDAVFYGHAEADTTCVDSQQSSKLVRLWRTYGKVAMTRASGEATFIPNSRALKNLLNKFYAGKLDEYAADFSLAAKQFAKRLRLIRNVSGLTATTLAAIPEFPATKATAGVFAKVGAVTTGLSKGADYVADKVDEARPAIKSANVMYREQLKNSGLTEKDGGLVIDSDSKFLKNTPELQEFRKLKNLADRKSVV